MSEDEPMVSNGSLLAVSRGRGAVDEEKRVASNLVAFSRGCLVSKSTAGVEMDTNTIAITQRGYHQDDERGDALEEARIILPLSNSSSRYDTPSRYH